MNVPFLSSPWIGNFAALLLAFGLSYLLTPVFARLAVRLKIVAVPLGGRHIHSKVTPLAGGLPVFCAFHATVIAAVFVAMPGSAQKLVATYPEFFIGSLFLLVVGLVDDARSLKPLAKLAGQFVAAGVVVLKGGLTVSALAHFVHLPYWLDALVAILWIVMAVNAFNLIDGMDGVASGLAVIAALGISGALFVTKQSTNAFPYMVFAGACAGFLRYNFNPASVFLGDTGSMFLGYTLAVLPLVTDSYREFIPSVSIPLLMMGIPFFDTVVAIWRRSTRAGLSRLLGDKNGGNVMTADKDHVHHRLLARFANQRKAVLFLYGINLLLVIAGLALLMEEGRGVGLFLIVFMVLTALVVHHLREVELLDTGRLVLLRTASKQWQMLRVPMYIMTDLVSLAAAWFLTRMLLRLPVSGDAFRFHFLFLVAPVFVLMLMLRVYDRIWTRARPYDYVLVPVVMVMSGMCSMAIIFLFNLSYPGCVRETLLFVVIGTWPLLGVRMLSAFLRDFVNILTERRMYRAHGPRTIVFGCGGRFSLYLHDCKSYKAAARQRCIVGVLDDNRLLKGRLISGFKVFGALEMLPLLVAKTGATEVLITARLSDKRLADVLRTASQANCEVHIFEVVEHGF